jgi:hypothetical protein
MFMPLAVCLLVHLVIVDLAGLVHAVHPVHVLFCAYQSSLSSQGGVSMRGSLHMVVRLTTICDKLNTLYSYQSINTR